MISRIITQSIRHELRKQRLISFSAPAGASNILTQPLYPFNPNESSPIRTNSNGNIIGSASAEKRKRAHRKNKKFIDIDGRHLTFLRLKLYYISRREGLVALPVAVEPDLFWLLLCEGGIFGPIARQKVRNA